MMSQEFAEIFTSIAEEKIIKSFAEECEIQKRDRKKDVILLVRSMIAAAAAGEGGRQAAVMRLYLENGGKHLGRSGFYRWFDDRLNKKMTLLAENALRVARDEAIDLPGYPTKFVSDWHIFDSTTVKVDDDLFDVFPGVGDYAAIKLHKRLSLGRGTVVDYHVSPAREHDSQHLLIDESMRGLGILIDLGYASLDTISKCQKHGVHFVMRLKDGWKPRITKIGRGTIVKPMGLNTDLDIVL